MSTIHLQTRKTFHCPSTAAASDYPPHPSRHHLGDRTVLCPVPTGWISHTGPKWSTHFCGEMRGQRSHTPPLSCQLESIKRSNKPYKSFQSENDVQSATFGSPLYTQPGCAMSHMRVPARFRASHSIYYMLRTTIQVILIISFSRPNAPFSCQVLPRLPCCRCTKYNWHSQVSMWHWKNN